MTISYNQMRLYAILTLHLRPHAGQIEPKGEVISSKIGQLAVIYTSKFKWAWWPQFLNHTLQILNFGNQPMF